MKDLYIDAHEELIEEMMLNNPKMTWDEAYERCADKAYDRYVDKFADMVDAARQRAKDESCRDADCPMEEK